MFTEWLPLLFLGFGFGVMHALDADHVMAVSTLANQQPSKMRTLRFSLQWALGHGGMLLCCGVLLLALGVTIPESLQHWAELSVGVLLIVLGLLCFWHFHHEKIRLVQHRHGDITHVHWHTEDHCHHTNEDKQNRSIFNKHQPVMVGMLHGLAGSAPVLALIPAVTSGYVIIGLAYLLLFSLGVMLSMLFFGVGFSWLQTYLQSRYQRLFLWSRYLLASAAIAFGGFWILQAV